jgi:hypothetical protein
MICDTRREGGSRKGPRFESRRSRDGSSGRIIPRCERPDNPGSEKYGEPGWAGVTRRRTKAIRCRLPGLPD